MAIRSVSVSSGNVLLPIRNVFNILHYRIDRTDIRLAWAPIVLSKSYMREFLTSDEHSPQHDIGLVHSSSKCVIVGWAEEFKAETHVKAPSDVVLGAGVDPKLLEGGAPGGVKEPVDCCVAEASAAKSRTNSKPAEPADM